MSDSIRETSPLITPDTLRKINKTNQAFYETHTKKNYGRTDVYGSQYSGTVENFGSEMLLEARKQRMEKPSLEGVFEINDYKYYFNLQYSNMIETYEQQGMLEAVLKKDVFLSNKEYTLKFTNCKDVYIPRSESWGQLHVNPDDPKDESKVFKDQFIYTTTAPKLLVKDLSSGTTTEVPLKLEVAEDWDSGYYFYNGFSTQKFIASYSGGTLVTVPITNDDAGLPFVWICVDIFQSLPPIEFTGNTLVANKPILVIGTDGQNTQHIYPLIYGVGSLPAQVNTGTWYLKAYSELDGFIPDGDNNYNAEVSQIFLTFKPNEGDPINYEIGFEHEYIKISLASTINALNWDIIRDSLNDPYHAEIAIEEYFGNATADTSVVLTAAFDISFSDDYLCYSYEGLCGEAKSGIHVDILSDLSINAVPKKNGTIHNLGDYDGIPRYFKMFHDKTIHRSHVELYAIRDRLNRFTQNTMDKQTAALLVDSAMPQEELKDATLDQEPAIVYQYDLEKYLYVTDPDKIVSMKNVVSEVVFVNENTFGNCNIPAHSKKKKFIYHGNRTFSLGTIEFDPELETARVYYLNNDSLAYVNNAAAEYPRAPRTLARICDIPTTYEQLMHVEYNAPTYLFDRKYVRMGAGFSYDDLYTLLNDRGLKLVMTPRLDGEPGNQWIYWNSAYLPDKNTLLQNGYYQWINTRNSLIEIDETNFEVLAGGTGYANGDKFYVLVGGKAYDGEVTNAVLGGFVNGIQMSIPDDATVSAYNLEGTNTPLKTVTTSTETGSGLQIELVANQRIIADHLPKEFVDGPPPENLVALAYDLFSNVFLYHLKDDWTWELSCQISGAENPNSRYDILTDPSLRSFNDAFFKIIFDKSYRLTLTPPLPVARIEETTITDYEGARGHCETGIEDATDLSQYIIDRNTPDTYYKLKLTSGADNGHYDLTTYERIPCDGYEVKLPRFHRNNTLKHYNASNRFEVYDISDIVRPEIVCQPSLFLFSPKRNKRVTGTDSNEIRDKILITAERTTNLNDYGLDIMPANGVLDHNIYYYPEYEFSEGYKQYEETIRAMQRSELITYIRDKFGSQAEPLIFEDTDYKYDYEGLVKYIMDRYPVDLPEYMKGDIKVKGYKGDVTVDTSTGESLLPNPPTGQYVSLTSEEFHERVLVNGTNDEQSRPVNIFIIDDATFTGFHDDFRVYDGNRFDISDTSIIIWRNEKYFFNGLRWVRFMHKTVEGYYNSNDGKFYYDQQYSSYITPDVDIIYHDIPTNKDYKWNGVSYVLINE